MTRKSILLFFLILLIGTFIFGGFKIIKKNSSGGNRSKTVEVVSTILSKCKKEDPKSTYTICLKESISQILDRYSIAESVLALEEYGRNKYPEFQIPECHDEAHVLGQLAGERTKDLGKVMVQCGRSCGYGCVHGAALGFLRKDPDIDNLSSVCEPFVKSDALGQDLIACNHGLGHGFVEITERDQVKPFLLCNKLSSDLVKQHCATGVFMELFESPIPTGDKVVSWPKDLNLFCKNLPDNYQKMCFTRAGIYEYKRSEDTARAQRACQGLESDFINDCFATLGLDFHFIFTGDEQKIWNACNSSNKDETLHCVYGALDSSFVTDESGSLGMKLCQLAGEDIRPECLKHLKEKMGSSS